MTKEVKKIICDSLQGGSSLFTMDFTSDKISWVKEMCQTLETSCNEYVDACNKYIHTSGEHIRKIYEELCGWETADDVKGKNSGLDLKHDTSIKVFNESSEELVNNSSSENLLACDQKQPTVSITEDSNLISLSSVSQAQNHGIACDHNDEPHSSGAIYCPDDSKENFNETKDTFPVCDDPTSSPRQDCSQLLESHRDNGSLTISSYVPPVEVNDTAGVSDVREDFTSSTNNILIQKSQTEDFEAITLEDFGDDAIENEIALISHCADKNTSFKKKLKNVFLSRKGHNVANYQHAGDITGMENKRSCSSSLAQESIESEWELL